MEAAARVRLHPSEACAAAVEVVRRLRAAEHAAYLVGGCVRDLVLGLEPKDYDVATSARPEAVKAIFRHVVEVGVAFGVVRVRLPAPSGGAVHEIEVATFRAEAGYSDGRRPDLVRYTDAREDVIRRDFTMNGLLLDPLADGGDGDEGALVVDWVGGLTDLSARVLRAIGEPAQRFEEDALRLLRAPRFAARFGFAIDAATAAAIRNAAPTLHRVSAERISAELSAMLTAPTVLQALELLRDLALAPVLWPRLCALDSGLVRCAGRFAALLDELARLEASANGAMPVEAAVRLPLALAVLHWDLRGDLDPRALGRDWRLSNADTGSLAEIWRLCAALRPLADTPPAEPLPACIVRLLREPEADAALLALIAESVSPRSREDIRFQVGWLRSMRRRRAQTAREAWWPELAVRGETLIARGYLPGPRFRLALAAAEDVQLEGGGTDAAVAAAVRVLSAR